jgi:dihydroorotate dehydrogenase
MYALARPFLFALDAETAHGLGLRAIEAAYRTGMNPLLADRIAPQPRTVFGIEFPNPVGLAAGLDKDGAHIDALAALGFGFIEIGTTTPRPQPGNPRPRMFRLPRAEAIINRLGFNNRGVDALVRNVECARFAGVLGINIGKNKDTPNEDAASDYLTCLRKVYARASYVTVNISSPNTSGLRDLQSGDSLRRLVASLLSEREQLATQHGRMVPILVKIAPDLTAAELDAMATVFLDEGIDGLICTNTTIDRDAVATLPHGQESGGLSGRPVFAKSTRVLAAMSERLHGRIPLIGVGGILEGADAAAKFEAGASLVQFYSGMVYRGPALIGESVAAITAWEKARR